MLPVFIDLRGRRTVVFGGGPVGLRKASYLAQESDVTVVSREFVEEFGSSGIRLVRMDIEEAMDDWIANSDFVVAATDDSSINEAIAQKCKVLGKYCNRADGVSDFLIPSTVSRSNYVVAVSTLGKSPGMSKYLRLYLNRVLDEKFEAMVDLQEELRAELKEIVPDQRERERILWNVLDDQGIWDTLVEDREAAKKMVMDGLVNIYGQDH